MSTFLLHYGANERRAMLLEKLGGRKVLQKATDIFYDRQVKDERLHKFFHGTELEILKWHQFNLMGIAFTHVPDNFDVRHLILVRHKRLFDEGLDETYFDIVMGHFEATLTEMNIDQQLIHDALDVVKPLRSIFAEGAEEARQRRRDEQKKRLFLLVSGALLTSIISGMLVASFRRQSSNRK